MHGKAYTKSMKKLAIFNAPHATLCLRQLPHVYRRSGFDDQRGDSVSKNVERNEVQAGKNISVTNLSGPIQRQASFADFEMQAHALVESGTGLTKDSLNKLYADVFETYYGDAVNVGPLNASEWSRIPHFLRNDNFYVYQYATSFAAATALAKMILEEGEPARQRFLTMLKSGSNDYPIELLKKAGVDMTTPQPIYDTLAVFEELVSELEQNLE